jgi:hypothetical protein
VATPGSPDDDAVTGRLDSIGPHSAVVHLVDGHLVKVEGGVDGLEVGQAGDVNGSEGLLGSVARLDDDYFGLLDFRTFQDHAAEDTTSELVFKGALKLSEDAWAESVPNLEIENDDVPGGLLADRLGDRIDRDLEMVHPA